MSKSGRARLILPGPGDGRAEKKRSLLQRALQRPRIEAKFIPGPDGKTGTGVISIIPRKLKKNDTSEPTAMSTAQVKNTAKVLSSAVQSSASKLKVLSATEKEYMNLEAKRLFQNQLSMEIQAEEALLPVQLEIINQLDFEGDPKEMIKQALKDKLLAAVNLKSIMEVAIAKIKLKGMELINDIPDHVSSGKLHPKLAALVELISYVDIRGIVPTIFSNKLSEKLEKFKIITMQVNIEEELDAIFPILKNNDKLLAHKQSLAAQIQKYQSLIVNYSAAYEELQRNLLLVADQTGTSPAELRQWQIDMVQAMFAALTQHSYYQNPDVKKGFAVKVNYHRTLFEKWIANPDFDQDDSLTTLLEETFASADMRETSRPDFDNNDDSSRTITCYRGELPSLSFSDAEDDKGAHELAPKSMSTSKIMIKAVEPKLTVLQACRIGNFTKVQELLPKKRKKCKPNEEFLQAMYVVCADGKLEIINHLFARVEYKNTINNLDKKDDKTPLMIAAQNGHAIVVDRLLVQSQVNPAIKNAKNETAEILAKIPEIAALIREKTQSRAKDSAAALVIDDAREKKSAMTTEDYKAVAMKVLKEVHSYFANAIQEKNELQLLFEECQTLYKTLLAFNKSNSIEINLLTSDYRSFVNDYQSMCQEEAVVLDAYAKIKSESMLALQEYSNVKGAHVHAMRNRAALTGRLQVLKDGMQQLKTRLVTKPEKKEEAAAVPTQILLTTKQDANASCEDDAKYKHFKTDKIEKLKNFIKMSYVPNVGDGKESEVLFREIQSEGLGYEIMQFMRMQLLISNGLEKSISRDQAALLSIALIHHKNLIPKVMLATEFSSSHEDILQFSRSLVEALAGGYPFEPEATKFGSALLAHGKKLRAEKASGGLEKDRIQPDERPLYTLITGSKRLKYARFKSLQPASKSEQSWFTIRDLCDSALSMVINIASVYGLYNRTIKKVAAESRHDEAALMRPVSDWALKMLA